MTIYALSSGPGIAGISVIRVSGSKTKDVIINLTQQEVPEQRVATLRKFNKMSNNELIDEGILIWFPGPNSYTGEDMAEFHVHGSKAVVDSIQAMISQIDGCRLADPGEFTKIAVHNGKINLLKAESISDLISSETEIQRQQAKVSNFLKSDGYLFVHIFCHQKACYLYEAKNESDWMTKNFFEGGIMPSEDIFNYFDQHLSVKRSWKVNGVNYGITSKKWLDNHDTNKSEIIAMFYKHYGNGRIWFYRWRIFFLTCARFFSINKGNDWFVSHYLFEKVEMRQ